MGEDPGGGGAGFGEGLGWLGGLHGRRREHRGGPGGGGASVGQGPWDGGTRVGEGPGEAAQASSSLEATTRASGRTLGRQRACELGGALVAAADLGGRCLQEAPCGGGAGSEWVGAGYGLRVLCMMWDPRILRKRHLSFPRPLRAGERKPVGAVEPSGIISSLLMVFTFPDDFYELTGVL